MKILLAKRYNTAIGSELAALASMNACEYGIAALAAIYSTEYTNVISNNLNNLLIY
jgi:hypothetical protein